MQSRRCQTVPNMIQHVNLASSADDAILYPQKIPASHAIPPTCNAADAVAVLLRVQEIPTYHAMPLTPQCDTWCEFPVADRPNAVHQFFRAAAGDPALIKAPWLLMIETDYVWMAPLQGVPRAETGESGWAFPYGYISPGHPCVPSHPLMRLCAVLAYCVH